MKAQLKLPAAVLQRADARAGRDRLHGDTAPRLREIVCDVLDTDGAAVAFALPSPSIWPLPLYELALLTAHELREHNSRTTVRIVTPETHALELFGPAARGAVCPTLASLGVDLSTRGATA
ncbi:MAG TPA: hypothetical protein VGR11_14740 [Solirubrobacteraceae bacterium]|nr:hypothetical protein [Solirubrobacteraceae bacterium]